jgi:DNA-binding protein HU-beta
MTPAMTSIDPGRGSLSISSPIPEATKCSVSAAAFQRGAGHLAMAPRIPAYCRPARQLKEPCVTKQEIVQALAQRLGLSRAQAAAAVDALFARDGIIAGELKKGGRIQIAGFGNFEIRKRAARRGRDPRTGTEIAIKASMVPAFRAGKALKDLIARRR